MRQEPRAGDAARFPDVEGSRLRAHGHDAPTVTATVTNALGLSVSSSFSVTVSKTCSVPPLISMAAGRDHSLALKQR